MLSINSDMKVYLLYLFTKDVPTDVHMATSGTMTDSSFHVRKKCFIVTRRDASYFYFFGISVILLLIFSVFLEKHSVISLHADTDLEQDSDSSTVTLHRRRLTHLSAYCLSDGLAVSRSVAAPGWCLCNIWQKKPLSGTSRWSLSLLLSA